MKFDINKFQQQISKYDIENKEVDQVDRTGQMTVISHILNHQNIDFIDFDSFSLEDALFALDAMENIALYDNGEESFFCDPKNPYMIFHLMENVIYNLATSKEKNYENLDDEEIFI